MNTSSPVTVSARDIVVHYGDVKALDGATLEIQSGRICGMVGMNGSGKSTLIKTIMGLIRPDTGTVNILGGPVSAALRAGTIGYVPQSEDVDWDFPVTVYDAVMMGRYGKLGKTRRAKNADHQAVRDALARVELDDLGARQIGQLSGGQRKRVFVARCLAQEAQILLLDEPFSGVDKKSEATISRVLKELAATGATVLISTHDLAALPSLATEACLLMRRVLVHGDPAEVLKPENLALAFGIDILEGQRQP